jgi:hypothetical protein
VFYGVVLTVILAVLPIRLAAQDVVSRNEEALSLIKFPWQQLKYNIVFKAPRPGYRAMTYPKQQKIEVYVRPADDTRLLAYDIAHELGHAIDMTYNTHETRKKWMALRGIDPATPWFGCSRCSDYNTPAGDFAETFALLLFGPENFASRIAPPPTAEQLPLLRPFFESWFSRPDSNPPTLQNASNDNQEPINSQPTR